MQAGIREILIITTPHDAPLFQKLLGDGSRLGCEFTYTIQENPEGLAQAFILGEEFIGDDSVALILGDNIFYGSSMAKVLQESKDPSGGVVFAYRVSDPERYGVVEFDGNMKALSIEEKPAAPKSDYAVPGLYFYDNRVVEIAKNLKEVGVLDRGTAWLDTGTFASLQQAGQFVEVIEERQGLKVGCIEEIAYEQGFIDADQLKQIAEPLVKSGYGKYLLKLLK